MIHKLKKIREQLTCILSRIWLTSLLLVAIIGISGCVPPVDNNGNRVGKKEAGLSLGNYPYYKQQREKDRVRSNKSTDNNTIEASEQNDGAILEFEKNMKRNKKNSKADEIKIDNHSDEFEERIDRTINNLQDEILEIKKILSDIAGDKLKPTTGKEYDANTKISANTSTEEFIIESAEVSTTSSKNIIKSEVNRELLENTFIIDSEEDATSITAKVAKPQKTEKIVVNKPKRDFNITKNNTPKQTPNIKAIAEKSTEKASEPAITKATVEMQGNLADARGKMAKGDYSGAMAQLEQTLQMSKDPSISAICNYLLGECSFNQRDYSRAIPYFQSVLASKSDKKDIAVARIAEAYYKVGKTNEARAAYQNLLEEYPKSEYSSKAKQMLQKL